jgi:hypothetical protein
MKIQEYKTAVGDSLVELDRKVNALIARGFEPFGNPYYIAPSEQVVDSPVCQAMIKLATPQQSASSGASFEPVAIDPN